MVYQTQYQKKAAAKKEKERKEKDALEKEQFDRFLERVEAAQLRQFYKFCDGESWHYCSYFDEDFVPSDSEDEGEMDGDGKNFRRRGRADIFRKTMFTSSSRAKAGDIDFNNGEDAEGETKGGEEGDSTEETDSLVTDSLVTEEGGEGGITMHPSISSLGDPSMLEGEGSIVLPGEEGLVGTVGGSKPEITIPDSPLKGGGPDGMGSPQHGMGSPQHGSGSPQHGPPIAKDDCVAPDKWFWGGKGKEAWWGIKSLKRRVAKIDLHENDLEGTLPGGPGTGIFPVVQPIPPKGKEEVILGHLRVLILFKNALSGPLPASYSKFTMLQHLDISHNQLSGDIPETIFEIKTLKRIHLEHNYMLTGSIPESFCDLDKLQAFTIHYNKVKGELPSNIGACKNLTEFSIHHNSMEGEIPESITELEKLERCYINNNHFAGEEGVLKELQERIFTAGNFKAEERVGYAKVLAVLPQPEESDDEDDEDGTGEETKDPTIDSSLVG